MACALTRQRAAGISNRSLSMSVAKGLGVFRSPRCNKIEATLGSRLKATHPSCPNRSRCAVQAQQEPTEAEEKASESTSKQAAEPSMKLDPELQKDISTFTKKVAATYAPGASNRTSKNPAVKGSLLYTIFEVQALAALGVGGLLAYNVIFPSDEPSIARLLGMWSIWIFTVPSLRARDCSTKEKDALNTLFLAIPLFNVTLPFVWKSFAAVFTGDVFILGAAYWWFLWRNPEEDK